MGSAAVEPSLTQQAYEALRADVLACRIAPGKKIKINEVGTKMSVSLGAVREALSRLAAEGLVIAEPQKGFRAAPISADELHDLTDVRIEIETLCIRRALTLGDVAWESRIIAAFHRLSRTPEREADDAARQGEAWALAHAEFHRSLVEGCGSTWLLRIRDSLYVQSERYRRLSMPLATTPRNLELEHRQIMEAALARDIPSATALIASHFNTTSNIIMQANEIADLLEDQDVSVGMNPDI